MKNIKRYNIIKTSDRGVYSQGDRLLVHISIKDSLTSLLSDPSSVNISIIDPCGNILINNDSMSKNSVGVYSYDYDFSSSATFGSYDISISTATFSHIEKYNFVIMPWDCSTEVRNLSGISQQNDITDEKLALILWDCYVEAQRDVLEEFTNQKPGPNIDTKKYIDGVNINFTVKFPPIALQNNCGDDVAAYWVDTHGVYHTAITSLINPVLGTVIISQPASVAIPNTARNIFVSYFRYSETYNERLFRKAVAYLAAHELILAFQSIYKTTMADIPSNQQKLLADMNRMKKKYQDVIDKIGFSIGCGR